MSCSQKASTMDGTKKKRRKSAEQATADAKASSSKKRSHSKSSQFWNAMKGWKPVEIDDDFLLGAEEGGFAGLEVLEDYTLIEPPGDTGAAAEPTATAADTEVPAGKGPKGKNAKRQKLSPKEAGPQQGGKHGQQKQKQQEEQQPPPDDVEALRARLAALESENTRLKQQQQGQKQQGQGQAHSQKQQGKHKQAGAVGGNTGSDGGANAATDAPSAEDPSATSPPVTSDDPGSGDADMGEEGRPLSKRKAKALAARESWAKKKERRKAANAAAKARAEERAAKKLQKQQGGDQEQGAAGGAGAAGDNGPTTAPQKDSVPDPESDQGHGEDTGDGMPDVDMSAWRLFALHPLLEKGLAMQGFTTPTEIQAAVLPAATRDCADIIGAAQTGSGKTLAFGLPIMQRLLQEREMREAEVAAAAAEGKPPPPADEKAGGLRALIMAPTRELALQVTAHLTALGKVAGVRVCGIVGGLAHVKQERLLRAKPQIVVATPGRLWELLREGGQPHLHDMSALSFLVIDEADRMVQKGHFQELSSILDLVPRPGKGPGVTSDADFHESLETVKALEARKQQQQQQQQQGQGQSQGKGKRSRNKFKAQQQQQKGGVGDAGDAPMEDGDQHEHQGQGRDQEGAEQQLQQQKENDPDGEQDGDDQGAGAEGGSEGGDGEEEGDEEGEGWEWEDPLLKKKQRSAEASREYHRRGPLQTMVFSATLTLPASMRRRLRKSGGGATGGTDLENLMDRVHFRGKPKIIDLTSGAQRVAGGVTEAHVTCLEGSDRDAVLYYLLARHPGRTLVFVNAISALRRVAALLKLLGLPAHALHAQQQQRQRLKALDRFKADEQAVLVATDVAARGLDIRDVRCVVHYQLPASADTYIHRCGRTARGAGREGLALALVSPAETMRFRSLCKTMGREGPPPAFPVDRTIMPMVLERVKLALKVDEVERALRKATAATTWTQRHAAEIDVDLDDEGSARAPQKGKVKPSAALLAEAKKQRKGGGDDEDNEQLTQARMRKQQEAQLRATRAQLAALLATPLAPRMSRSFFTGGAAAGVLLSSAPQRGSGGAKTGINGMSGGPAAGGAGDGHHDGGDGAGAVGAETLVPTEQQTNGMPKPAASKGSQLLQAATRAQQLHKEKKGSRGSEDGGDGSEESDDGMGGYGSSDDGDVSLGSSSGSDSDSDSDSDSEGGYGGNRGMQAAQRAGSAVAAAQAAAAVAGQVNQAVAVAARMAASMQAMQQGKQQQQQRKKNKGIIPGLDLKRLPSKQELAMQELARKQARKQIRRGQLAGGVRKGGRPGKRGKSSLTPGAAAMVAAASAAGGGGKRGGLVVIPAALGRDAQGPDALEALRRRMAAVAHAS